MSKKLSGVTGMIKFHVCRVVNLSNQDIQHSQSRKNKELPNVNQAYNAHRS